VKFDGFGATALSQRQLWTIAMAGSVALVASAYWLVSRSAEKVISLFSTWKWYARPQSSDLTTLDIWTAIVGYIRGDESNRSSQLLNDVIDQFQPASNPRYAPRVLEAGGRIATFCNIFAQDVMRALGLELPWGFANDLVAYLGSSEGASNGWQRVDAATAQALANVGKPVLVAAAVLGGTGHVAVVRPGAYSAAQGPTVANVGAVNFASGAAVRGLGTELLARADYYAHA
jgi:hypothetical protein